MDRRTMLSCLAGAALSNAQGPTIDTVTGPVAMDSLGTTLTHEHVLVNFSGGTYDRQDAFAAALPRLQEVQRLGCRTFVECTPAYIGRDPLLLRDLARRTGLHILTNTGYYGAANDKYVPPHAWKEPAERLAERWTEEARKGIENTGIRPAFIKTGVDAGPLSEIDRKLIEAAAICHRDTGLRIHAHTGNGAAAMDILRVLETLKTAAGAYVWVHAQNEKDRALHLRAAKAGAWISFDGVSANRLQPHVTAVIDMIRAGFVGQLLVSQDSGWYRVGEPGGGMFNGYTFLFDTFVPALKKNGATEADIRALLVVNPARALARSVR